MGYLASRVMLLSAPSAPGEGSALSTFWWGWKVLWCFMKHHSHVHPGEGSAHAAPRRGFCGGDSVQEILTFMCSPVRALRKERLIVDDLEELCPGK